MNTPIKSQQTYSLLIFAILVFFVSGNFLISNPKSAQAVSTPADILVPVYDPINAVPITATAKSTAAEEAKEYVLDRIAISAAKVAIKSLTGSIVNWINSGFEGSPAFVSDPASFFTDTADQVAGNFIAGYVYDSDGDGQPDDSLGFLCEPFRDNIRLALNFNYSASYEQRNFCRLSDVISNVENYTKFTSGDFSQGGWNSWFEITQNPSNNFLGAYIEAEGELSKRIASALDLEKTKLDWGHGFLSSRDCLEMNIETEECARWGDIQTPGKVIESQLEDVLGADLAQLELADEFDEIVSALVGQLVQTVFTSGLSSFSAGESNSEYFDESSGSSSPLTVWCAANTSSASLGGDVTWTANVYEGGPGIPKYSWVGEEIAEMDTPSVTVTYTTTGFKTASVKVTKSGENLVQSCNSGVLIE